MHDDPALENIDVMTDATQATAFTRYTNNASTVLTHMTGRTNAKWVHSLVLKVPASEPLNFSIPGRAPPAALNARRTVSAPAVARAPSMKRLTFSAPSPASSSGSSPS